MLQSNLPPRTKMAFRFWQVKSRIVSFIYCTIHIFCPPYVSNLRKILHSWEANYLRIRMKLLRSFTGGERSPQTVRRWMTARALQRRAGTCTCAQQSTFIATRPTVIILPAFAYLNLSSAQKQRKTFHHSMIHTSNQRIVHSRMTVRARTSNV